jgi:hypothetical protein
MTNVQSDDYLVAARALKEIFQMSHQTLAPTLPSFPSGNVMFHLPSEIDKESEAKKGIIKLMLLLIRGNINIKSPMVSSITSALPSKGMQVILNQPRAAQASQFADLVRMTFELAKLKITRTSVQRSSWSELSQKLLRLRSFKAILLLRRLPVSNLRQILSSLQFFFPRGTGV